MNVENARRMQTLPSKKSVNKQTKPKMYVIKSNHLIQSLKEAFIQESKRVLKVRRLNAFSDLHSRVCNLCIVNTTYQITLHALIIFKITYLFQLLRQNSENTLVLISFMFWYIAGAKLRVAIYL